MSNILSRDQMVCQAYASVEETADQIVSDPALAERICKEVNSQLPSNQQFDVASLNKRLLNLRRRGEEKGGLIRKQRNFNGRNKKPR